MPLKSKRPEDIQTLADVYNYPAVALAEIQRLRQLLPPGEPTNRVQRQFFRIHRWVWQRFVAPGGVPITPKSAVKRALLASHQLATLYELSVSDDGPLFANLMDVVIYTVLSLPIPSHLGVNPMVEPHVITVPRICSVVEVFYGESMGGDAPDQPSAITVVDCAQFFVAQSRRDIYALLSGRIEYVLAQGRL